MISKKTECLAKIKNEGLELIKFDKVKFSYSWGDVEKEYVTYKDKDGYIYRQQLGNFVAQIDGKPFVSSNIYSLENIKYYIEINNIETKLLSEKYNNGKEKLLFKCKCGDTFLRPWKDFKDGKQYLCYSCGRKKATDATRYSKDEIIKIIESKGYKIIEPLNYKNKKSIINITDGNYFYSTTFDCISHNDNIKKFHVANKFTIENIKIYMKELNITSELLSEKYTGNNDMLDFRCECGEEFKMPLAQIHRRPFQCICETCRNRHSLYERRVEQVLIDNNIIFKQEYTFKDCVYIGRLRFDFALFDEDGNLKGLIEVDGQQHFSPSHFVFGGDEEKRLKDFETTKIRDGIKDEYCQTHNIPLLRIKYTKIGEDGTYPSIIKEFISNIY